MNDRRVIGRMDTWYLRFQRVSAAVDRAPIKAPLAGINSCPLISQLPLTPPHHTTPHHTTPHHTTPHHTTPHHTTPHHTTPPSIHSSIKEKCMHACITPGCIGLRVVAGLPCCGTTITTLCLQGLHVCHCCRCCKSCCCGCCCYGECCCCCGCC